MSRILSFSNETLKDQILKGKTWLKNKAQATGSDTDLEGNPYDDEQWQFRLELYEKMVDEYRFRRLNQAEIMEDQELLENEKKSRESIFYVGPEDKKQLSYGQKWSAWFQLREEGIKRGLFRFLAATQFDKEP